ncbi:hypothetical protein TWF281_011810 [Arthrobotrys megalospora]
MATPPSALKNQWFGTLVHRPENENLRGTPLKLAVGTKENPTDLAPGLRPRPHPEVPMMHGEFQGVPPPPPGPAPILPEAPVFKLPPRPPKDPDTPATDSPTGPKQIKPPDQGAMMNELANALSKRRTKQFEEPKRQPPLKSPSLQDQMNAELPGAIAKLKPTGKGSSVSRMKQDIEQAAEREEEHKRASPVTPAPKPTPRRFKTPALGTISEEPVTEQEEEKEKPVNLKKPTEPPPSKKAESPKVEPTPKPPVRPEAVPKIKQPDVVPQDKAEKRPVKTEVNPALQVLHEAKIAVDRLDPYILWSIKVLGVLLILLGLTKTEVYLWIISWNVHIWNRLYL